MNPLTSQQSHNPAALPGGQVTANQHRQDGLRPNRRFSRAGVIVFGAVALLAGGAASHSTGVNAQTSPTPPTTTQPVGVPACEPAVASLGPVPTTERETRRRQEARSDRLIWIAV